MNAVLLSIKPKYCELIASGAKTIEVRKTAPKLNQDFKCYIYQTKNPEYCRDLQAIGEIDHALAVESSSGKIIGEFICDGIIDLHDHGAAFIAITDIDLKGCCLNYNQLHNYANGKTLFGWHISNLIIYDEPKELNEFKRYNRTEENSPCAHTKWLYEPCETCKECNLIRPPQNWCYVEEIAMRGAEK